MQRKLHITPNFICTSQILFLARCRRDGVHCVIIIFPLKLNDNVVGHRYDSVPELVVGENNLTGGYHKGISPQFRAESVRYSRHALRPVVRATGCRI